MHITQWKMGCLSILVQYAKQQELQRKSQNQGKIEGVDKNI